MVPRTAAFALVAVWGWSNAAFAAATPEGAASVRGQLERYLGRGPVTVTPAGEAYRIDVDLKTMLSGLQRVGVNLDPVTVEMMATPQADGTWHVTSSGLPLVTVKAGSQTTSIAVNNQAFDGLFDPRVPAFTQSTSHYDSLSIGTVGTGPGAGAVQTRQLDHGTQTLSATPVGDGIIDATVTQGNASYAQEITFDAAAGAQHIAVKGGPSTDTFTVEKLPIRGLLDLWAFLVAHPSQAELARASADFKDKLRHALPGFAHIAQDGTLGTLAVDTPLGPITARSLASHVDATGLTDNGAIALALKADDLVVPTARLPLWAPALLPKSIDLHDSLSGYRLDEAAATAIDGLDLGAPQPWPEATTETIRNELGPRDKLVVTLGDNHITSSTLDLRFGGEIRLVTPIPSFTVTVHAIGIDKTIAAIQATAAKDPTATQALAMLMLVKGYGRSDPDGSLVWALAGDGTGAATVNGVPLPFGPAK